MLHQLLEQGLFNVSGARPELRHAVDHVHHQMKPVKVIEHDHVEWRGGRALLFVATHMQIMMVGAPVGQPVNQPRIAMEGENDRLVPGKEDVEIFVTQAVRVFAGGLQAHEIDHVDDADLQFRKIAAQHFNRGEGFQSWHVTGASHDDIRFAALIVAGPGPNADAGRAMLNSALNVEPLRGGLFTGDNDVDIMTAAQAMVSDGEKSVCVGRQIDANDLGFLVHRMIDEAGVLMAESVMVLTPNMRGQQIIQRGQRTPPRNVTSDLEPLGVLIEH